MTAYDERLIAIIDARIQKAASTVTARGTVVSRDTIGPGAMVVFDGDAIAMPAKVLGHVHVIENDRVVLALVANTWVVMGTFSRRQLGEASGKTAGPSSGNTTTSGTYVDMPAAATAVLTKRYALTAVRIGLAFDLFTTAAPTTVEAAVRVAGVPNTVTAATYTPTDSTVITFVMNTASAHLKLSGFTRVVGLPAGQFNITGRWRRVGGTGTLTQDSNDYVAIEADEVFRTDGN